MPLSRAVSTAAAAAKGARYKLEPIRDYYSIPSDCRHVRLFCAAIDFRIYIETTSMCGSSYHHFTATRLYVVGR